MTFAVGNDKLTMKHVLVGALLVALGLWGMFAWWANFGLVMRGALPFVLLLLGLVAILSGYYRLSGDLEEDEGD